MAKSTSAGAWLKDWDALGKQFWNAWSENAQASVKGQSVPVHPGFEIWAQMFSGRGEPQNEAVDRMLSSGRQFATLMQAALGQLGGDGASKPAEVIEAWRKAAHDALGGMTATKNPVADAMRQAVGEGSKGFEQLFGEFASGAAPFKSEMLAGLSVPAFGYGRDKQAQTQKMIAASVEYSEALNAYNVEMLKASQRGLERMESKLAERSEPGRELTSMRGFYDLWIDAMEEGYADVALSPEFRKVYGELVNTQMRLRQLVQQEVERTAASVGLPTRTELDGVHRKIADLKRRLAEMEEALGSTEVARAQPVAAKAPRGESPAKARKPVASKRAATGKSKAFAQQLAATRARSTAPRKSKRK